MKDDRTRGLEELADVFGDRFERREAPGEEVGAVASVLPARRRGSAPL